MLRGLVEILSFSRISNVSSDRPFYRSLSTDRVSHLYRDAMAGATPPRGGILRKDAGGWFIAEGTVARVSHVTIGAAFTGFKYESKPNYIPQTEFQRRPVWARLQEGVCVEVRPAVDPRPDGFVDAVLVLTGAAGSRDKKGKTKEFVFIQLAKVARIEIPESVLRRACDDDQVTSWQEHAFPKGAGRSVPGVFAEGDAVFFGFFEPLIDAETNPDGLFFGRAGMFRLPYDLSPRDLLPEEQKGRTPLDLSTALFGRVDEKGGSGEAFASRVRFCDAKAVGNRPDWFEAILVPRVLSSPKPTAFAHYLVQDGRLAADQLRTYVREDRDETTIRGHKLYWHRWDPEVGLRAVTWVDPRTGSPDGYGQKLAQMRAASAGQQGTVGDTQCTVMTPVKAGVRFVGQIRFDNLRPEELGALLAALRLPEGCAHKLGMGKPLGLGSVRIESRVRFLDPVARYAAWGDPGYFEAEGKERSSAEAFEELVLEHAEVTREPMSPETDEVTGLRRIARLDSLCTLLSWNRRPTDPNRTSYPTLEEYKLKKVLPTPAAVVGGNDPVAADVPAPTERGRSGAREGHERPRAPSLQRSSGFPKTVVQVVTNGAVVEVVVLPRERWLKKGTRPTVDVVGTQFSGQLKDPLPESLEPGQRLKAIVVVASATKGQSQFKVKET